MIKVGTCLLLLSFFLGKSISLAAVPDDDHFRVETLVEGLEDAMEIAVLPTGDVFIVERTGAFKWYEPESEEVKLVKKFEVSVKNESRSRETGLLGVAVDPNFMKNGWVYCYYSPKEENEHRLARFTFREGALGDEKVLLTVEQDRDPGVCHEGGSLAFDKNGLLYLSTGDNTNPFKSDGYAPLDERRGNEHIDSQRSAGNTNDLRGKILRIRPTEDGKYEIPEGNLFPEKTRKARPEIFVMGCRNPWRIGVDQRTGILYWGEVGPDARKDTSRGPRGYCEINQAAKAGNYGWPFFVADNKAYAEYDFDRKRIGEFFDPESPENRSRNNSGLKELPPAQVPLWFVPRSCYCAGPVYYYGDYGDVSGKLPPELDGCLMSYDWNNGKMQLTKLAEDQSVEWKRDWLGSKRFVHPSDVEMGGDGAMYVLEYGSSWYDGTDGKLKKVTYSEEKVEAEVVEADPRLEGVSRDHPGYGLLAEAVCLSCHQTQVKSVGPRYLDVALRYREDKDAVKKLVEKILKGGVGVWGEIPMPPQPQYNEEQAELMVDAILSLAPEEHKE